MEPSIDIIKELQLEGLPEEEKDNLVAGLSQALQARVSLRVMDMLSDLEKKEMEVLVEQGDDQRVGMYINSKVPGIDSIMKQELLKLREELLSGNEMIKEALDKRSQQ